MSDQSGERKPCEGTAALGADARMPLALKTFLFAVVLLGAVLFAHSLAEIGDVAVNGYFLALVALTIASGRFVIDVPGRPATVSVSEVFVFAIVVVFGPAPATVTVALDGLRASLTQKDRRLYRALFNTAEPALSIWMAGQAFVVVSRTATDWALPDGVVRVGAAIAMALTFFLFNSGLTAIAIALESGTPAYAIWHRHAAYLAINYYAAASLATVAISAGGVNYAIVGLVIPLLVLSYVAYQEASTRIGAAHRHVADVERLYRAATEMLAIAVDAKDQVTHGHIRRVQRHTLAVARALGVDDPQELKAIEAGALLHDIGKLAVPDYVLNKPSALTRAEYEVIKTHAPMGARILQAVDFPFPVVPIVRHHHEQWNGGGYPDGLVGAEIPVGARIIAVVDCFDALTSDRPYRPAMSVEQAIALLRSRAGSFYDPTVVETFIDLIPSLQHDDRGFTDAIEVRGSLIAGLSRTGHDRHPLLDVEDRPTGRGVPLRVRTHIDGRLAQIAGAEGCLFEIDASGDALIVTHATPAMRNAMLSFRVPVGAGVSGWVAAHRNTIRRADAALDLGDRADELSLRGCVSTPVFVRGELRGALTVYSGHAEALGDATIGSIGVLAQEIGLLLARPDGSPELLDRGLVTRATTHYSSRMPAVAAQG
ncbi:MAG TPA: HD domain-containing phosphohydrolase [Vicinamibacterales bacterium]